MAVREDALDAFARGWREWLAQITPTVIARPQAFLPGSFYSVTPSGERLDLIAEPAGKLGAPRAIPGMEALLAAQQAVARAFLASAREIAASNGVAWPSELEAATRANLLKHGLGVLDV